MIKPPTLKAGDRVGIVATARRVRPEDVESAFTILTMWDLDVVLSPYLFSEDHSYLAGKDEQRLSALQQFLDDPSISAVFCARGGYGTTRIIDSIDFSEFKEHPKWVVGFSDVTSLHLKLSSLGFQSIHGTMPIFFGKEDSKSSIESLRKILFDEGLELFAHPDEFNRFGSGTGVLIGGNLSLIVDSLGTPYELDTKGKILILEEVDEYLYKLDRMMVQLKRAGKLKSLAGLMVGHFTDIKDTELKFGESFQEIIRNHTSEYNFPIGFNFPTGHENPNFSWICGERGRLIVDENESRLCLSR